VALLREADGEWQPNVTEPHDAHPHAAQCTDEMAEETP
jgi:hypothetical protein